MSDWELVSDNGNDWEVAVDNAQSNRINNARTGAKEKFLNQGAALLYGAGQGAENIFKGLRQGSTASEEEIPHHWKPERVQNQPEVYEPSSNFEQYVNPEEMDAFDIGKWGPEAIGLLLSKGKSGAQLGLRGLKATGKGIKGAATFPGRITNTAVGEKIIGEANKRHQHFKNKFGDFFGRVEAEELKNPKKAEKIYKMESHQDIPLNVESKYSTKESEKIVGKENLAQFKKMADNDILGPLNDYLQNPNIENQHWLKSSVNTFLHDMEHAKVARGLNDAEREAVIAATEMQKRLKSNITKELEILSPEFKKEYAKLGEEYAKEYLPFALTKDIRKARLPEFSTEHIAPHHLPYELGQKHNRYFRRMMGEEFPELKANRAAAIALKYGLPISTGTYYIGKGLFGD